MNTSEAKEQVIYLINHLKAAKINDVKFNEMYVTQLEELLNCKLPSELIEWLSYFNGVYMYANYFLGIGYTKGDVKGKYMDCEEILLDYWVKNKYLPIIHDGSGFFIMDLIGRFGIKNAILYTNLADVDPPEPYYMEQSNLWKFLYRIICELKFTWDDDYSDIISWWGTDKDKMLKYDPELKNCINMNSPWSSRSRRNK